MRYFLALLIAQASFGATLLWDKNSEYYVTGYKVHLGYSPRSYTNHADVGTNTSWMIPIDPRKKNYFAVTAYTAAGIESAFSAEVFFTQPAYVGMAIPTGRFYIDGSVSLTNWLNLQIVDGPTNVFFAATTELGFFRRRPYFLSAKGFKTGKLK